MGSDDANLGDRHQPLSKVVAQTHVPSIWVDALVTVTLYLFQK